MFARFWLIIPNWIYALLAGLLLLGGLTTLIFFNDEGPVDGGLLTLVSVLAIGIGAVVLWDIHRQWREKRYLERKFAEEQQRVWYARAIAERRTPDIPGIEPDERLALGARREMDVSALLRDKTLIELERLFLGQAGRLRRKLRQK